MTDDKENSGLSVTRRNLLKALVSIPVFGAFVISFLDKKLQDDIRRQMLMEELGVSETAAPSIIDSAISRPPGKKLRLGIIGFGGEGESLVKHAGFAHPEVVEDLRKRARENPRDKEYETWLSNEDLNVAFTGVCDVFDARAEKGVEASKSWHAGAVTYPAAKRFRRYTDMLSSGEVDAVIIATPDHWHARMAADAAAAGIHVYCEKCMTRTEADAHMMAAAVKKSGIVFQLGHQNRQSESHLKAQEIMKAGILGPITLVEATTNRNTKWGAWVWDIDKKGNPQTIDWAHFEENAGHKVPFSLERFFRWRCWFDYGTGLSGDLLSHEYDGVNMVLGVGIPKSVVSSGGIYYFKDGRDVPDVFQAVYEYPDRDLTFVYSATLANGNDRGLVFMGHDASMRVSGTLTVNADGESTRYKQKMEDGVIERGRPMFTYQPGYKGIDAVTSATAAYFASRGLLYTYRAGKRVSAYHLHLAEWLDAIRNGGQTSCNIDRGFEEAITCHMATRSFLENRKVTWDPVRQRIV